MTIYLLSDLNFCGMWLVNIVLEPLPSKSEVLYLTDLLVVCVLR